MVTLHQSGEDACGKQTCADTHSYTAVIARMGVLMGGAYTAKCVKETSRPGLLEHQGVRALVKFEFGFPQRLVVRRLVDGVIRGPRNSDTRVAA